VTEPVDTARSMVMTTCGTPEEADHIAAALVEWKLAACVQKVRISSTYMWEGRVHHDDEVLLLIKSSTDRVPAVSDTIRSLHSYDLPEIIEVPITGGDPDYLEWIGRMTHPD